MKRTRRISINGKLNTDTEWRRILGVSKGLYDHRRSRGWSRIKALTTPVLPNGVRIDGRPRHAGRMITYNGKKQTLKQHCRDLGLPYNRIYQRIRILGWTIKRAFTEPLFGDGMFGQKKSRLRVICEDAGADFAIVRNRVRTLGWKLTDALDTPLLHRDNPLRYPGKGIQMDGELLTRAEASRRLGGDPALVHARMRIGWTSDEASDIPRLNPSEKYVRVKANARRKELISLGLIPN